MKAIHYLGKFLISVGVGILLFVGWTLWGTGLYTQQEQDALAAEFDRQPVIRAQPLPVARKHFIKVPEDYRPGPGAPVFRVRIPAIELNTMVVEGVGTEQLRRGPGHYPECRPGFDRPYCTELPEVWPGERGRVIVSGHRTTYGAPFWGMDKLRNGDEIQVETRWGKFTYVVTGKEVVPPDSTDIANPAATNGSEIVFTTCNPRFSAAQRLIVYAELRETATV